MLTTMPLALRSPKPMINRLQFHAILCAWLWLQAVTLGAPPLSSAADGPQLNDVYGDVRPISLPTERDARTAATHDEVSDLSSTESNSPTRRGRLRVDSLSEWASERDGLTMSNYDLTLRHGLYPVFGPPPPIVSGAFSYTNIDAPSSTGLPDDLYDLSVGVSWIRRLSPQWVLRLTAGAAFASDFHNSSSDAWQFRGGAFALYQQDANWQWAFGVLLTGREDLPVLPGVGAIWTPAPRWRISVMMPQPRVEWMLRETSHRQDWLYVGGGISGGTWAFERSNGTDDRVSYREWRIAAGWDSRPPGPFGRPGPGFSWSAELAYLLGRRFEFENGLPDFSPGNTLALRARLRF